MSDAGYLLVICEKPDAAKRVASALGGAVRAERVDDGVVVYRVEGKKGRYVVSAASGLGC